MALAVPSTLAPMEAESADRLPTGPGWQYEPKWDGFRCLAFRDGHSVDLRSKAGQPLVRYFPDVEAALRALHGHLFVLDGELVVPVGGRFSFEELQLRLHPAAGRVAKLAAAHPALLIAFDLLAENGESFLTESLAQRRRRLEAFYARQDGQMLLLCPATQDMEVAKRWLARAGGGMDGVMAKRLDQPYQPGGRGAMRKVKAIRTADCVVGGFRYGAGSRVVGSLLLGLYDAAGLLHHVGFTSALRAAEREALTPLLEDIIEPPGFTGRAPGATSRWSRGRSSEWQPLRPRLVVEVAYDHVSGGRFRHGVRLLRWRPDKAPRQCLMDQIETAPATLPLP